jgi:hypothetical protein
VGTVQQHHQLTCNVLLYTVLVSDLGILWQQVISLMQLVNKFVMLGILVSGGWGSSFLYGLYAVIRSIEVVNIRLDTSLVH